jgi:hypothetical protein
VAAGAASPGESDDGLPSAPPRHVKVLAFPKGVRLAVVVPAEAVSPGESDDRLPSNDCEGQWPATGRVGQRRAESTKPIHE